MHSLKFSEHVKKKYSAKKKKKAVTYISGDANPDERKGPRGLLTLL